ncbi:hypothetical protein D9757_010546 [Collybiopsis confluens]|uniref:Uncharacterized protein n=1 Tax=Collybiopsis confluens TaxID=2823264 RepID=A0A8H5GY74_9AGAR|nr:hypothetical protein D9757_010546 [Collybiopsis confluens]
MVANSAGNATILIDNAMFVEQAVQPLEIIQFVYFALWGMYSVLFCVYIYFRGNLLNRTRKRPLIYPASLILLYLFITIHTILSTMSFNRALTSNTIIQLSYDPSFSLSAASEPDSRYREFLDFDFAAEVCYMIASLIADGILICRCYHLWTARKSIIAAPIMLFVLNFGLFLAGLVTEAREEEHSILPFLLRSSMELGQKALNLTLTLSVAFAAGTVVINLLLIVLIAGRIFWLAKTTNNASEHTSRTYSRLIVTILESGFLYTFSLLVTMGLLPVVNFATLLPITAQTMGIAPTLIMVRVDLSASAESVSTKEENV